ncbi:hypothetical protein [Dyadobacter sandarakinus]|uniref:Carboxypeptidase regulatory-like domain-containing protein n=1 Tax=Dyadobacter sandarakinus TaxID=2747268 RepID=A0ABX7I1R2_9BACT|nr:hypothetical protein [Dyadobacter sandarakinus]QRQ99869.1 hypothetical protein HWI92_02515 [Dyadobacter sandarakinus]
MLLSGAEAWCQQAVKVRLSNAPGKITPGGHFTLFFEVKSEQGLPAALHESLGLPEKWNLLSQRKPEKTLGEKEVRYFFVIGTPADYASGNYTVNFRLKAGNEQVITPVNILIEEVRKVDLFIVSQPEFVREGDTLRVEYMIQNSGNKKEKFALKTNRGKVDHVADSLTLEPNSRLNVTVSQVVPFTDNNAWQSSSDLSVSIPEYASNIYQVVSIPVFSSRVKKIDPYFRFPIEIGGGYLTYRYGERVMTAYQYSATGRGYLDQKEKHFADFIIRGPNQFVFPAVGSYDQYSLDYVYNKKTSVSVGDYVLQLNNLMEFGRFGRGVKLDQQFRRIGYTAFYQKARFYLNQKDSYGGKFLFKFGEASHVGVHYMSKNVMYRGKEFWSNLTGISAAIRTKDFQLETELAHGKAQGKADYGAFTRLQVVKKWFSLASNVIYAGKNFYGFYNNSLLISNNIGFNITSKITLGLSSNFSNINPSLDANLYSVSPREKSYMAFASYQPNKKNRVFVFYSTQEREDRQRPAQFHYSENFGNISYNYNADKFSLFYQGRYGFAQNLLVADNTGKKESFSNLVQPTFRVLPWAWLGGYLEHQHTSKFSAADIVENLFFYGGNARINIKQNLYASVLYRNNYAPDELYERRSYLDVSVLLDLKRHRFTLTGGRSYVPNIQNRNQNTLFLSLKYALKLNVPLSRKRNTGTLKGKLTGEGFSRQGNLIQLGSHKFLTDSTGMFSFQSITPDRYYLSISQNDSRNEGVVPAVKMPMFIDVKADSVQVIEIPFTRTGSITGQVDFAKSNQGGLSSVLNEKPPVLVKLYNETSSFLTELNEKGEFSFKEMKPGNWHITAFIPGSQDRYLVEDGNRDVDVQTDKTMRVTFRVRPNEKRIHFSGKSFEVSIKK